MTPALVVQPGDDIPSLETYVGCVEFVAERLHMRTSPRQHFPGELLRRDQLLPQRGVEFTLLDNALVEGALCPRFKFYSARQGVPVWDLFKALLTDISPQTLRLYLLEIKARHFQGTWATQLDGRDGQEVFIWAVPGMDVYSHAQLERVPPLLQIPDVWRMAHVKRALATGQIERLKVKGGLSAAELLEQIASEAGRPFCSFWGSTIDPGSRLVTVTHHGRPHSSFTLVL